MELLITSWGDIHCLYEETISLSQLGELSIRRASHVEPNEFGEWLADLSPVGGPRLGPFPTRSAALRAEVTWLSQHWLTESA